jgi:Tol biopolymer transport system component
MPEPAPNFPPIELVNLDGSGRQRIVNGGWPALSPDGTRLLYTDERGFHLFDLLTGQDSVLGVDGYAPMWSPDGSQILYTSFPGLYVMQADGSGSHAIDVAGAEIAPPIGWLPDNRTIIYSLMTGEGFAFVMRDLDSGETRQLFSVQNKWGFGTVSPDGQWIAFLDRMFGAGYGVFISRLDGSERRTVAAGDIPMLYRLAWSPDGRWLLVNTQDYRPSDTTAAYRPILIELSTCRVIALPDVHGDVEGWGRQEP